ncbi:MULTISPECIES: hypothetical protein [Chryseobacterium]|uniref:hypothetical protein n=1 Tax=Chryseobacterium TaxID=59732 RepID=UPI002358A487|nr:MULTISPECIES: hypothetical protein [unclassified Chryseobacterium]MDC8104387.1 DinB family protein [Chryseobacterium sp. B21-037]MDQ1804001.1 hypothetical protein [Chryseobacterium sp. CKR4-1]WBV57919.1 hypothetical protein PFY10_05625 [Chryseobacterium daecheongense]
MESKSNDIEIINLQVLSNYKVILMNIDGISNEEAMVFPNGDANCMNWILGHLIYIRNAFINVLGGESVWDEEKYSCYNRGEIPLQRKDEFADFETLKSYLDETQDRLIQKISHLERINPDQVNDIATLCLHEIYHSGQFGYLRRILGKPGAIK